MRPVVLDVLFEEWNNVVGVNYLFCMIGVPKLSNEFFGCFNADIVA